MADEEVPGRTVVCNDSHATHERGGAYLGNSISTIKYPIPFVKLPYYVPNLAKEGFEQFRRMANLYFLAVACLSLTPWSPVMYETTWAPLLLVVGISMLKETLEDFKRHKQDMAQNNAPVDVVLGSGGGGGAWASTEWKALRPGDVVLVRRDEFFPADLLFLASSHPEASCYVETKNLDGETNLKLKKAVEESRELTVESAAQWPGAQLQCDAPNNSLYTFSGTLTLTPAGEEKRVKVSISPANVLLRGSNLRNTEWIIGCVIYAGHDSKVMMNAMAPPSKRSTIEQRLDRIVACMLALLLLMCLLGSTIMAQRTRLNGKNMWYMMPEMACETNPASCTTNSYKPSKFNVIGAYEGITQFILYGYLIPISLYVSIEMVKVMQSMNFINFDRAMYDKESDTPALARTSNLNEELGQIATILSDKTGTLTQNRMDFFKCSIAGVKYGAGVTDIERSIAERAGRPLPPAPPPLPGATETGYNFADTRLLDGDRLAWRTLPEADVVRAFFQLLAVCHTVIPEGEPTPEEIKYQCESPDEAAFVVAAKRLGFFFYARNASGVTIKEPPASASAAGDVSSHYEVLNVLEFNSTRKRMSVVMRTPAGKLLLLCKGADSVIYERLSSKAALNPHRDATARHMDEFAQAGLRTLCLAYAPLEEEAYAAWNAQFFEAKTSLVDRSAKLDAVAELIEKDLILLGSTAIEDKLQVGVPACIEHLSQAGIALWVLTGDKQDTAINIGMACSLLREGMKQHIISLEALVAEAGGRMNDDSVRTRASASVQRQLTATLNALRRAEEGPRQGGGLPPQFSLIIDGFGLTFALSEELSDLFWDVSRRCAAVICCRVSPLQKALVTGLVKSKGKVTLAIGDGANDVGMIQAAHIGVGISGQEGMQAVMASDFAIAQFRFLERLILVHGRYNYKRIARLVTYFFYKNMYFGFTLFWYNAWAFFSGQPCYNDYMMSCFNLFFTSLPIICVAIMDQDISAPVSHHFPALYKDGQRNDYFTWRVIIYWALNGWYQSVVTFLAVFWGQYRLQSDRASGQAMEMWGAGSAMYTIVVITVTLQLAMTINYWTWLHHVVFWLSISLKYAFILVMGTLPGSFSTSAKDLFAHIVGGTPAYWLMVGVTPIICLLPDFTFRAFRRLLDPTDYQIVQEAASLYGHNPPPVRPAGGEDLAESPAGGEEEEAGWADMEQYTGRAAAAASGMRETVGAVVGNTETLTRSMEMTTAKLVAAGKTGEALNSTILDYAA